MFHTESGEMGSGSTGEGEVLASAGRDQEAESKEGRTAAEGRELAGEEETADTEGGKTATERSKGPEEEETADTKGGKTATERGKGPAEEETAAPEEGKAAAGAHAAAAVAPGMILGLGTGSTVAYFLRALGERVRAGELPDILGVSTSLRTEKKAGELGIPLISLEAVDALDLTVDGADEVDPRLDLIKGLGGALLREKMVAQATRRFVIIADERKMVSRLGSRSPVPVEVVPFSWRTHLPFLRELGADPVIRLGPEGHPLTTDNGNYILDCHFQQGIDDPYALQDALERRAGIVESGLFLGMAHEVLVGSGTGVRKVTRGSAGEN